MAVIYLLLVIILLIFTVLIVAGIYNMLVASRNGVTKAWRLLEDPLKQRLLLASDLAAELKENSRLDTAPLEARIQIQQRLAGFPLLSRHDRFEAENALGQVLGDLLLLAEQDPELEAHEPLVNLLESLSETENRVILSRQVYNDAVVQYNNRLESLSLLAGLFRFYPEAFFLEEEAVSPEVEAVQR